MIIYGGGKLGELAQEIFGEEVDYVVDKFKPECIHPHDVPDMDRLGKTIVICVTSEPYNYIRNYLKLLGFMSIKSFYDVETVLGNGWTSPETPDKFLEVRNKLEDEKSICHYTMFYNWRVYREERLFENHPPTNDKYQIPEVLAALGESYFTFEEIQSGWTLKDIEKRRTEYYLIGKYDYVKIHAEGLELAIIKRNMDYFKVNRPVLAVACYHSDDGLYRIQKELMDGLPDYRWLFRSHCFQSQSCYLYGIPKERS